MPDMTLLTPGRIDGFDTPNRMVMAPMTRSRAAPAEVPSELAIEYYTQRASAGLIITEGTAPSREGHRIRTHAGDLFARADRRVAQDHGRGPRQGRPHVPAADARRSHRPCREPDDERRRWWRRRRSVPPGQMWTDSLGLQDLDAPRALETAKSPA